MVLKMAEHHLQKVVALHQRDWEARLPNFLLAYRASTHNTMDLTPDNQVLMRELCLPYDLLFGVPPNKEQPTINHAEDAVDLVDRYMTSNYAHQHRGWPVPK
jgi:hypothetical protein